MSLTIAILGASGVYGRHLLPRLVARGYQVRALVRRPQDAAPAHACGVDVRSADIFDARALREGLKGVDVALNLATALRDPGPAGDYALNNRVRREGVPIFLRACEAAGVGRVIQQSIAMAHAAGDAWADEDTPAPVLADPVGAAAIETACAIEDMVRGSRLDWLILSGGLFYGPGTASDDRWFERARAGALRVPGDGSDYVSLIHIADMAAATLAAIERGVARQTLIVADDAPARWRDVLGFVTAAVAVPPPAPGGRQTFPSWRVRNRRAREALGWAPFYGDYRSGLSR